MGTIKKLSTIQKSNNSKAIIHDLLEIIQCKFYDQESFNKLNKSEQILYEINKMHGEIMNGGIHQYLSNSSGDQFQEHLHYLKKIKASEIESIFMRVLNSFPDRDIPKDRIKRNNLLDKIENEVEYFDPESKEFYDFHENLEDSLVAFLRKI